ncbi:uncharacterized protein LOC134242249 [Saccostrea cucullata]|uniref:uncharacterized protein LOC134242249 n=1 Tax=Saccostrea cuccullata TaxID=36930 RepID=UPI002ED5A0AF
MRHLEQLESFRPIRAGNSKDLEKFADILDVAVVNLKDTGWTDELKNGSLYVKLQKKIPETMLSTYHRWVFEKLYENGSFRNLNFELSPMRLCMVYKWILTIIRTGKSVSVTEYIRKHSLEMLRPFQKYVRCVKDNKKLDVSQKWKFVRESKLCYRCLGTGHFGSSCKKSRSCGIDNCSETHHRLLHNGNHNANRSADKYQHGISTSELRQNAPGFYPHKETQKPNPSVNSVEDKNCDTQRSVKHDRTLTCHGEEPQFIALRTIPVIVRNGSKTIRVNALLDDASTRTYVNSDVAAELGLHGKLQRVTVGVLNDKTESFETMPVEFQIESTDGRIKTKVEALTADKVTGDMCVVNWREYQNKWNHLKGLEFPVLGKHQLVDILIGIDNSELHYAYREIRGRPDEPVARLTPLGWTCVGKIYGTNEKCVQTHYNRTYFLHSQRSEKETDKILCKFWEMEDFSEPKKKQLFSPEERAVYSKVKESLKFVVDHYQVPIPWKTDARNLPNNYDMALQRLENTEKRLMRNEEVRDSYSKTIEQYIEKGYIRKVDRDEEKSGTWYLPHFPVIRPDKTTTKSRIVFDASAKHGGVSLHDMIYCGPKL